MNLSAVHVSAQSRLEEIGDGAFNTTAWVDAFPDGPVMLAEHVLYRYKGSVESGRYEIPSHVTTIAAFAFNGVDVDEIVIPEGMTEISVSALGASGAKRIVLPQSIITIGNGAFAQSENLQEIVLPKNIQTIGRSAF